MSIVRANLWQNTSGVTQQTILQARHVVNNTVYTVSGSGSLTGLSVTITPTSSTSRFLLHCSIGIVSWSSSGATIAWSFARNGSSLNTISGSTYNGMVGLVDNNSNLSRQGPAWSWIDSPNTTSPVTYTVVYATDGVMWIGRRGIDTFISGSQQLQVLEIAA